MAVSDLKPSFRGEPSSCVTSNCVSKARKKIPSDFFVRPPSAVCINNKAVDLQSRRIFGASGHIIYFRAIVDLAFTLCSSSQSGFEGRCWQCQSRCGWRYCCRCSGGNLEWTRGTSKKMTGAPPCRHSKLGRQLRIRNRWVSVAEGQKTVEYAFSKDASEFSPLLECCILFAASQKFVSRLSFKTRSVFTGIEPAGRHG